MATSREISLIISAQDRATAELQKIGNSFDSLERAGQALMSVLGPLAAGLAVGEIIEARVQWDRYQTALVAVTGTQTAARVEMEFVRDLAERLGIDLLSATEGYTKLAASTKGTRLEGEETRKIFEAVASASAALGLSVDDTSGALMALAQMVSKGKVSAEELRQQLGERLPGAFRIAAGAVGVTTAEFDKMLSQGRVISDDFLPKFADALMAAFGPGVQAASESSQAAIARFNNALLELKLELAGAGIFDLFVSGARELTEAMKDPAMIASLRSMGEMLGGIAQGSGPAFALAVEGVIKAFQLLGIGIQVPLALLRTAGEVLAATAAAMVAAAEGDFKGAWAILTDPRPAQVFSESFAGIEKSVDAFLGTAERAAAGAERMAGATKGTTAGLIDWGVVMRDSIIDVDGLASATGEANEAVDKQKEKILAAKEAAIVKKQAELELAGASREVSRSLAEQAIADAEAAKRSKEATLSLEKQTEAANKFAVEMEKLASNERIRNIELAVGLQTTLIEADVERAVAIIATLDTAIKSTGDLLGGLFGNLTDTDDFSDKLALTKQIDEENARREEAFRLQKQLTEAQIESMRIRNEQMRSGGGLIKIESTGLEPALEMIMWQVLEKIQIRVNEEASELLIGMGA